MCVRCRTGRRRGQGALNSAGLLGRGTLLPVVRSGTAFDSERLGPRHDTNPSLEVMAPMKGCRHGRFGARASRSRSLQSRFALEVVAVALRARGRCNRASRSRSLQSRFALEVVAIALRARGRCNRASRSRSLQSRFALEVVAIALRARGRCNRASRSRSLRSQTALQLVSLWCFQSPKAAAVAAAAQTSRPSDSVRTQFGRSLGARRP